MRIVTLLMASLTLLVSVAATAAVDGEPGEYVVFYHHDVLGSPVTATNEQGQVIWHERTESYGKSEGRFSQNGNAFEDNALPAVDSRQGYTGHTLDNSAGLTYMKARYYDHNIGRFLSNDPVGFEPNNPALFNRYAYAANSPYKYVDPDGEDAKDVQLIISDIGANFPGIRSPHSVIYEKLPEGVNGQATLDYFNPSLVLPLEAETDTLSKDEFNALYDTILHESMHLTDSAFRRMLDGMTELTDNHKEIFARVFYEMNNIQSKPIEKVWDKDGEVESAKGIDPDQLYDDTREVDIE